MREIRMLRSTWRGLETWHGRDAVTLADERARQQATRTSTYTGAPVSDPTCERLGVKFPGPTRQLQTHALQQILRASAKSQAGSPGSRSPLLGGGERGGGLSPAGKLGDRNVDAASDASRSERKIDLAIKLIRKKIANDLHSIARPSWSLDGGATAFLPFDA